LRFRVYGLGSRRKMLEIIIRDLKFEVSSVRLGGEGMRLRC
jgi:hypothetical protein